MNLIEHPVGQTLSIIGGEPTIHKDFLEIINNLEGYKLTVTTNCKSSFYKDLSNIDLIRPKKSTTLRINTSYHPAYLSAEEYLRVINIYKSKGFFVDQTAYVNHPEVHQFDSRIDEIKKVMTVTSPPYLGFYDKRDGFHAPFDESLNHPNENYEDVESARTICGISDFDAFRHICGQSSKSSAMCVHPSKSLMIGPDGKYYNCHYKMYYDIDPVCTIKDFKTVPDAPVNCNHYGFCNWCDIPRVGCVKNRTAAPLILNKLYDKREREVPEIKTLMADIDSFSRKYDLEFNHLKWFEYAYSIFYSGHRHRGSVLDVGSAKSVFPYYLASKGYDVTTLDVADFDYREKLEDKFSVKAVLGDIRKFNPDLEGKYDMITALSCSGAH